MIDWGHGAELVRETRSGITYQYREVSYQRRQSGRCPVCGARRTRARTFTATVNPFNRDPETGLPRTPGQVYDTLKVKAAEWTPNFMCTTHEDTR